MKRNLDTIKKGADIFGLLFLGDGATISEPPFLNIMASGENTPVSVLEIGYCQGHLGDGGKKIGSLICHKCLDHTKEVDTANKLTYRVMFDGSPNVQM